MGCMSLGRRSVDALSTPEEDMLCAKEAECSAAEGTTRRSERLRVARGVGVSLIVSALEVGTRAMAVGTRVTVFVRGVGTRVTVFVRGAGIRVTVFTCGVGTFRCKDTFASFISPNAEATAGKNPSGGRWLSGMHLSGKSPAH